MPAKYLAHNVSQGGGAVGLLQVSQIRGFGGYSAGCSRIAAGQEHAESRKSLGPTWLRQPPSHLRHHHLENGEGRSLVLAQPKRFLCVAGGDGAIAQPRQRLSRHFADRFVIVGQQDCFRPASNVSRIRIARGRGLLFTRLLHRG